MCAFYVYFSLQMLRIIVVILKCWIKVLFPLILYQKKVLIFLSRLITRELVTYFFSLFSISGETLEKLTEAVYLPLSLSPLSLSPLCLISLR